MKRVAHFHPSDLGSVGRLAVEATIGITDLVEALHRDIARVAPPFGEPGKGRTTGITGFVYRTVRQVTGLVGSGLDAVLSRLAPALASHPPSAEREAVLAALNGVLGDHLEGSGNPLAIAMRLRKAGVPLVLEREALAHAIADPRPRVAVLLHGLCMNDLQWRREGHDLGERLEGGGAFTSLYLHYNTGRHISANGRELAAMLESLARAWPVPLEQLVLVGHSMGGLLARSACHYGRVAGHAWPGKLGALAFLGTPHFGAPLERGGKFLDRLLDRSPYTAPFARLGRLRSAGINDLHHGALLDEDWRGRDRLVAPRAPRSSLPLPEGVPCFAIAGTLSPTARGLRGRLLGDGLVPVASALGRHASARRSLGLPESRQWVGAGLGHLDLLSSREAGDTLLRWLLPA